MQIIRRLSLTLYKRGLGDASNSVGGLKSTQCRRKSFAAADPAQVKKKPRRVPKEERRKMVEAFVNKYRALNDGKFPPTEVARKELGGSYYTIKNLIQELKYTSKMPVPIQAEKEIHEEVKTVEGESILPSAENVSKPKEEDSPGPVASPTVSVEIIEDRKSETPAIKESKKNNEEEKLITEESGSTLTKEVKKADEENPKEEEADPRGPVASPTVSVEIIEDTKSETPAIKEPKKNNEEEKLMTEEPGSTLTKEVKKADEENPKAEEAGPPGPVASPTVSVEIIEDWKSETPAIKEPKKNNEEEELMKVEPGSTLTKEVKKADQENQKAEEADPAIGEEVKKANELEEPKADEAENFEFDDLKQMDEQKHSPELENPTRELSTEHKAVTLAESKSSLWRSLKSLAGGILNMWKKL